LESYNMHLADAGKHRQIFVNVFWAAVWN